MPKRIPNKEVKDSEASRNSLVAMALSLAEWTGTSENDRLMVSNQVPPSGIEAIVILFIE